MSSQIKPLAFVLRWDESEDWGYLSVVAEGYQKPIFIRFVDMGAEPLSSELLRQAVKCEPGMCEVWFAALSNEKTVV